MRRAVPGRTGDVLRTRETKCVQREVSERRHHLRGVARPDLRPIFVECHVADPVNAVFDRPVATHQIEEPSTVGIPPLQAGDAEVDLMAELDRSVARLDLDVGFDSEDLLGVREVDVLPGVDPGCRPDSTDLNSSMPDAGRLVRRGKKTPNACSRCSREVRAGCPSP